MNSEIAKLFLPIAKYPFVGELVPCPVCGERSNWPVAGVDRRLKRLRTVACDHCGTLYSNPMPTDEELSLYYSKYYRFDYQLATSKPKDRHLLKRAKEAEARTKNVADLMPASAGERTLDFGCGSGEFVSRMLNAGFDAHGFEPGDTYGNYARKSLGDRVKIARWQSVHYEKKFDLVTCFHVAEHLRDPLAAMRQIVEWLNPRGRAYIEVPDMIGVGMKGFGALHFAHVVGFNQHNLILAAAKVGLTPLRIVAPTGIIFELGDFRDLESSG